MAPGLRDGGEPAFIEFVPMRPRNGTVAGEHRAAPLPREALGEWGADELPARRPARPTVMRERPVAPPAPPARPAPELRRDTRSGYQDAWLNRMRHAGTPLELRCLDGTVVRGRLLQFDTFSLILQGEAGECLVFKHAVATILPKSAC